MSHNYDRFERRRQTRSHSVLGHWVPLVVTVTVATIGLAAWIWSERRDSVDDEEDDGHYPRPDYGPPPPGGYQGGPPPGPYAPGPSGGPQGYPPPPGGPEVRSAQEEESFMARMSGAIRRTPSPQQLFNTAGKQITAGVAAAGAAVGGALQSIREENKDEYEDHSRWSEEAEERRRTVALSEQSTQAVKSQADAFGASAGKTGSLVQQGTGSRGNVRRKTVAIVINAESSIGELRPGDESFQSDHASVLSHLPTHYDPSRTDLFILIYAPSLANTSASHASLPSSYSAISTPGATPGDELVSISPKPFNEGSSPLYDALYHQATALVGRSTQIMPFTSPTGFVHMLKHLSPEIAYVSDGLAGEGGRNVLELRAWVRQLVVVVGDEAGGLLDTEDEGEGTGGRRWYDESDAVGLGKGVEIVDAGRIGEEWERRVNLRE